MHCLSVLLIRQHTFPIFFFFNDTATTEIYTLSLHDALPIYPRQSSDPVPKFRLWEICRIPVVFDDRRPPLLHGLRPPPDRKSTRLNSSHDQISYAVFCLKKKNNDSGSHVVTRICHTSPQLHT